MHLTEQHLFEFGMGLKIGLYNFVTCSKGPLTVETLHRCKMPMTRTTNRSALREHLKVCNTLAAV